MGYQVGRICYATEQEAQNVLMTQVVPTIDKDGALHHPVFDGTKWTYQEQPVKPTFPQCRFGEYAEAGRMMGGFIVASVAAAMVVTVILRAIKDVG